eukprot:9504174-Pyramimonas_sp.AAC.4
MIALRALRFRQGGRPPRGMRESAKIIARRASRSGQEGRPPRGAAGEREDKRARRFVQRNARASAPQVRCRSWHLIVNQGVTGCLGVVLKPLGLKA